MGLVSGLVLTWDAKTGRELSRASVPAGCDAKFNAAGDELVFTEGGKHFAWDARTGAVRPSAKGPPETWRRHAFSPDDKVLAEVEYRTTPHDGDHGHQTSVLSLFHMPARTRITESTLDLHYSEVYGFSPDGRLFAVGDSRKVLLLDAATGRVRGTFYPRGPGSAYSGRVCWSPSSKLLALTTPDGRVEIWDVAKLAGR